MRHVHRAVPAIAIFLALIWISGPGWSAPKSNLLNVNTASSSELQELPGIGPKKAEAIVNYRKANGPFQVVDDLVEVKGIGQKTLEKLRPLITVGKPKKGKKVKSHADVQAPGSG